MKNTNWWLINGVFLIITTILNVTLNFISNPAIISTIIINLALGLLIAIGLITKSKIALWVQTIAIAISFLSGISSLASSSKANGGFVSDFIFIINVISLALIIMLWQDIRKNKVPAKK